MALGLFAAEGGESLRPVLSDGGRAALTAVSVLAHREFGSKAAGLFPAHRASVLLDMAGAYP